MRYGRFGTDFSHSFGGSDSDLGFGPARGLNPKPELPLTTKDLIGIDLTHNIHTSDLGAVRGGGSGGGTTSFANYTSRLPGGYNITIEFKGSSRTTDLYNVFVVAADRLSAMIVGDAPDAKVITGKGAPKIVDDIYITAELGNIDGLYGILRGT